MSPESKVFFLKDRAFLFEQVRSFFSLKGVLEVDTPLLSHSAPIDEHIDVMTVDLQGSSGYLHTSPEYAMKRLLSLGIGDIFQMGHVFRLGEVGARHNPEFTMIEWYRQNFEFSFFIEEALSLIQIFLGPLSYKHTTYREAFLYFAQIDYLSASKSDLLSYIKSKEIELGFEENWSKDSLLDLIMGSIIEPQLGKNEIFVIIDYPASQAALAKKEQKGDELVAKRFEIYYQGIELANGYQELTDAQEQRLRLIESNEQRTRMGKLSLPLDEHLLSALEQGIPECCGVAVGFDRLMMLRHKTTTLGEILPFSWQEV